jgi:hypothetical protein
MEATLARHEALAAALIERYDRILVQHPGEGDSLFAVFGCAADAVAAALRLADLSVQPEPDGGSRVADAQRVP